MFISSKSLLWNILGMMIIEMILCYAWWGLLLTSIDGHGKLRNSLRYNLSIFEDCFDWIFLQSRGSNLSYIFLIIICYYFFVEFGFALTIKMTVWHGWTLLINKSVILQPGSSGKLSQRLDRSVHVMITWSTVIRCLLWCNENDTIFFVMCLKIDTLTGGWRLRLWRQPTQHSIAV